MVNKPNLFITHEFGSLVIIQEKDQKVTVIKVVKYTYAILFSNLNFLLNMLYSIYIWWDCGFMVSLRSYNV